MIARVVLGQALAVEVAQVADLLTAPEPDREHHPATLHRESAALERGCRHAARCRPVGPAGDWIAGGGAIEKRDEVAALPELYLVRARRVKPRLDDKRLARVNHASSRSVQVARLHSGRCRGAVAPVGGAAALVARAIGTAAESRVQRRSVRFHVRVKQVHLDALFVALEPGPAHDARAYAAVVRPVGVARAALRGSARQPAANAAERRGVRAMWTRET